MVKERIGPSAGHTLRFLIKGQVFDLSGGSLLFRLEEAGDFASGGEERESDHRVVKIIETADQFAGDRRGLGGFLSFAVLRERSPMANVLVVLYELLACELLAQSHYCATIAELVESLTCEFRLFIKHFFSYLCRGVVCFVCHNGIWFSSGKAWLEISR